MKKNTKLALGGIGLAAVAYYIYKKMNPAVTPALTKTNYSGPVGDRLGADGGYVNQSGAWNKFKAAVKPYLPQVYHPENASAGPAKKKAFADDNFVGFADGGYVNKGDLYNRNLRYGMTGQTTFFTNESQKLNY